MLDNRSFEERHEAQAANERAERAIRVRRFIAEHEENEVDELFDAMRDLIDLRQQAEEVFVSRYYRGVHGIFDSIEENLRDY